MCFFNRCHCRRKLDRCLRNIHTHVFCGNEFIGTIEAREHNECERRHHCRRHCRHRCGCEII